MGLGFLAAYGTAARLAPPPLLFLFFTLVAAVVFLWVAISAYDFRHMAIPDSWSYAAAALALGFAVLAGVGSPLLLALAGPLVALPLYLLWLVSGGRWLGAGDPKLALSVGWLLRASGGFLPLFKWVSAVARTFITRRLGPPLPLEERATSFWQIAKEFVGGIIPLGE